MCGIIGYFGTQEAQGILLDCLGHLEYHGHDSAGIAVIAGGEPGTQRSLGKSTSRRLQPEKTSLPGHPDIVHTQWATHGRPSDINSHPHTDCSDTPANVYSSTIQDHMALPMQLLAYHAAVQRGWDVGKLM